MKKLISIILICVLMCAVMSVYSFAANSPSAEELYVPNYLTYMYRICGVNGRLLNFISMQDFTITVRDDLELFNSMPNLLYMFDFVGTYEFQEGEYIEYPFYFDTNRNINANIDGNPIDIENVGHGYWILHLNQYGTVAVFLEPEVIA